MTEILDFANLPDLGPHISTFALRKLIMASQFLKGAPAKLAQDKVNDLPPVPGLLPNAPRLPGPLLRMILTPPLGLESLPWLVYECAVKSLPNLPSYLLGWSWTPIGIEGMPGPPMFPICLGAYTQLSSLLTFGRPIVHPQVMMGLFLQTQGPPIDRTILMMSLKGPRVGIPFLPPRQSMLYLPLWISQLMTLTLDPSHRHQQPRCCRWGSCYASLGIAPLDLSILSLMTSKLRCGLASEEGANRLPVPDPSLFKHDCWLFILSKSFDKVCFPSYVI